MRNLFKALLTLILVLSLVLGATSCEILEELGIFEDGSATDNNNTAVPPTTDGDTDNGEQPDGEDGGTDEGENPDQGFVLGDFEGGIIYLPNEEDPVTSDPYVDVDKQEFYANYTPAISYRDAYYRSQHGLMSGAIGEQDQAPTVSEYQPTLDGKLVRNTAYIYSEDGNTYYVVDAHGNVVNKIYKGGAYVMLNEVAAYVFAFGEPPANHSESKKTRPSASPFGEYLRVNHSVFTGDTRRYPYEPELPDISGCGGDLTYYEMDVGTTGTDCDPEYDAVIYNNGYTITRGAARIVYTKYDKDRDGVIEVDETYLFYTYNHYNDFQEYLNYEGGWGEIFGNITGGGRISSKYDYNPTPYVEVAHASLVRADGTPVVQVSAFIIAWIPSRENA